MHHTDHRAGDAPKPPFPIESIEKPNKSGNQPQNSRKKKPLFTSLVISIETWPPPISEPRGTQHDATDCVYPRSSYFPSRNRQGSRQRVVCPAPFPNKQGTCQAQGCNTAVQDKKEAGWVEKIQQGSHAPHVIQAATIGQAMLERKWLVPESTSHQTIHDKCLHEFELAHNLGLRCRGLNTKWCQHILKLSKSSSKCLEITPRRLCIFSILTALQVLALASIGPKGNLK